LALTISDYYGSLGKISFSASVNLSDDLKKYLGLPAKCIEVDASTNNEFILTLQFLDYNGNYVIQKFSEFNFRLHNEGTVFDEDYHERLGKLKAYLAFNSLENPTEKEPFSVGEFINYLNIDEEFEIAKIISISDEPRYKYFCYVYERGVYTSVSDQRAHKVPDQEYFKEMYKDIVVMTEEEQNKAAAGNVTNNVQRDLAKTDSGNPVSNYYKSQGYKPHESNSNMKSTDYRANQTAKTYSQSTDFVITVTGSDKNIIHKLYNDEAIKALAVFDISKSLFTITENGKEVTKEFPVITLTKEQAAFTSVSKTVLSCAYDATEKYLEYNKGKKFTYSDKTWYTNHPNTESSGLPFDSTITVLNDLVAPYGIGVKKVYMIKGTSGFEETGVWKNVLGINPAASIDSNTSNTDFVNQLGGEETAKSLAFDVNQYAFEFIAEDELIGKPVIAMCGGPSMTSTNHTSNQPLGHASYYGPRERVRNWKIAIEYDFIENCNRFIPAPTIDYNPVLMQKLDWRECRDNNGIKVKDFVASYQEKLEYLEDPEYIGKLKDKLSKTFVGSNYKAPSTYSAPSTSTKPNHYSDSNESKKKTYQTGKKTKQEKQKASFIDLKRSFQTYSDLKAYLLKNKIETKSFFYEIYDNQCIFSKNYQIKESLFIPLTFSDFIEPETLFGAFNISTLDQHNYFKVFYDNLDINNRITGEVVIDHLQYMYVPSNVLSLFSELVEFLDRALEHETETDYLQSVSGKDKRELYDRHLKMAFHTFIKDNNRVYMYFNDLMHDVINALFGFYTVAEVYLALCLLDSVSNIKTESFNPEINLLDLKINDWIFKSFLIDVYNCLVYAQNDYVEGLRSGVNDELDPIINSNFDEFSIQEIYKLIENIRKEIIIIEQLADDDKKNQINIENDSENDSLVETNLSYTPSLLNHGNNHSPNEEYYEAWAMYYG
jgi:hypothetical protein